MVLLFICFIIIWAWPAVEVVIRISDRAGGMHSKCANESLAAWDSVTIEENWAVPWRFPKFHQIPKGSHHFLIFGMFGMFG